MVLSFTKAIKLGEGTENGFGGDFDREVRQNLSEVVTALRT